jgi:hypothetical protein
MGKGREEVVSLEGRTWERDESELVHARSGE